MIVDREDGTLVVVTGKTRMGKTGWTAEKVHGARRLLVWDAKNEWGRKFDCEVITTWGDLACAISPKLPAQPERYAFQCPVTRENFEHWCRFAFIFVKAAPSTLIVEEICDVSPAQKASQEWGELVRKSLEWGPTIYVLTNRPQESDKTMLGNATYFHCHAAGFFKDQEYIAKNLLNVPVETVAKLQPLEWLERYTQDGRLVMGKLGGDDVELQTDGTAPADIGAPPLDPKPKRPPRKAGRPKKKVSVNPPPKKSAHPVATRRKKSSQPSKKSPR